MKKQAVLPNVLTACSLCCGLFVIFKMNMIHPGTAVISQVQTCVWILLLAAVFDTLDGALARVIKAESEFGGFFDSMADSVSFGIAPAVLVLKTLSTGSFLSTLLAAGAMTYSVAGVLRLVRFSTTPPSDDPEKKYSFTGLPITGAAMIVVSPMLLLMSDSWQSICPTAESTRTLVATVVFFLIGYLMVSRWRFPSMKAINIKVASPYLLFFVAIVSSAALLMAVDYFPVVFFVISWGYLCAAWGYAIVCLVRGKRNEALDDTPDEG